MGRALTLVLRKLFMFYAAISDPQFYAVAIPAVLLLGISKSGFGSGFGSIAVPLMALSVSVPAAAAILMPVLLAMDLLGLAAFRKDFDRALLRRLIPFGLLGTVIGTLLFKWISAPIVAGIVGALTLIFLSQRLLFPPGPNRAQPPHWLGAVLATASGFTSFVAHAGGPPISAYVLPQKLPPLRYTATLAVFFFIINLSKWIPYSHLGLLNIQFLSTSVLLLPLVPIGVGTGIWMAKRIQPTLFYHFIHTGMLLTGLKLLWDALSYASR